MSERNPKDAAFVAPRKEEGHNNTTSVETLQEEPDAQPSGNRVRTNSSTMIKTTPNDKIDRIVGFLAGSYDCVYNGVYGGTLYAGSKALFFLGYMFFFEKKITIAWEKIRHVQKLDQGVAVITKDETIHSFTSIHAPARAWVILVSLHNDALLDVPSRLSSSSSAAASRKCARLMSPDARHQSNRIMKRRNSEPASATQRFLDVDMASSGHDTDDDQGDNQAETTVANTPPSMSSQKEIFRQSDAAPTEAKGSTYFGNTLTSTETKHPVLDWFKDLAETKVEVIEEKVGALKLHATPCSHAGYTGKLYAGNNGIMFAGKRMPWENEKVFIRSYTIRQIQIQGKEEKNSPKRSKRKRGISIITKDGQVFGFEYMENADKVWASLIALHNENLATQGETLSRKGRFSLRRMNSDPLMPSRVSFDEASNGTVDADDTDQQSTTSSSLATPTLAEEWATEVAREKDFTNTVVKAQTLSCTMDKFMELFVVDQAPYSMAKFLEGKGDLELEVSEWEKSNQNNETRVLHYKHPVNAPLAPPMAGARKEQSFRRYGDFGLCIETKTFVDDVPMADCFFVSDRVRVTPKGESAVAVTMEFDITFIKSTMFKSIIGKTTKSECTELFQALFGYFKTSLGAMAPNADKASDTIQRPRLSQPPAPPLYQSTIVPIVLCFVVVFQMYIMWEVRKISVIVQSMQSMQNQCPTIPGPIFFS